MTNLTWHGLVEIVTTSRCSPRHREARPLPGSCDRRPQLPSTRPRMLPRPASSRCAGPRPASASSGRTQCSGGTRHASGDRRARFGARPRARRRPETANSAASSTPGPRPRARRRRRPRLRARRRHRAAAELVGVDWPRDLGAPARSAAAGRARRRPCARARDPSGQRDAKHVVREAASRGWMQRTTNGGLQWGLLQKEQKKPTTRCFNGACRPEGGRKTATTKRASMGPASRREAGRQLDS